MGRYALILTVLISLVAPCWAADYTTGANDEVGKNSVWENMTILHAGCVEHDLIIKTLLTVDENFSIDGGYIYAITCTTGDEVITTNCGKFRQTAAEIAAAGCTIVDNGGVEYGVPWGLDSINRITWPNGNRCTGDE